MADLKLGVKLANLHLPFRKAITVASSLGADAVEIDARGELNPRSLSKSGIRQIRKWLGDLNLSVCGIGFQTKRGYHVDEGLQARIDATKQSLDFAFALGANVVINQVGTIPDDEASSEWNLLCSALADIGQYSHKAGAFLAMKTGTEDSTRMRKLIESLPEGSAGVAFDPGSLIINSFSASEALANLSNSILYVVARDAVRDLAQGRGLEVPLGRGSIDLPEIIGTLGESGYRGYYAVHREGGSNVWQEMGDAISYLRNV